MTVARREERGVQGVPSASLLRLNRNTFSNVLVVGGAPEQRAALAGVLHRDGRLRDAQFCAVDAAQDRDRLYRSLLAWLGHDPGPAPLDCERGTLFVDDVAALPIDVQRLLIALARRLDGAPADSRRGPGPSRLAAGCGSEPAGEVMHGRLLAALHDSLDKLTVHLDSVTHASGPRDGADHGPATATDTLKVDRSADD